MLQHHQPHPLAEHLLADFPRNPRQDELFELAREYYLRTEAYDREVCSGWNEREHSALPLTAHELALVNRHARLVRDELVQRAGGDGDGLRVAMRAYVASGLLERELRATAPPPLAERLRRLELQA